MKEATWLRGTNPDAMLEFLGRKASDRQRRLLACACCAAIERLMSDRRSRRAVAVGERLVEGTATETAVTTVKAGAAAADQAANTRARRVPDDAEVEGWKAWADCAAAYAATRAVARARGAVE